jgi:hypothetical protein
MKHQVAVLTIVAIGVVLSGSAVSQTPVKLEISEGVTLVDGVFLNGQGPYRFILDTGSQSNQLDPQVAQQLGINAMLTFILNTPAGRSSVRGGRLDTVRLGSMQAADQEFLLTSFAGVRRHCPGVVGMIGQEFLGKFDYLLDLRRGRFAPADPPSTGMRVPMRMIGGRMAVRTNFGNLILDSGAECMLLFRPAIRMAGGSIVTAEGTLMSISTEPDQILRIGTHLYRIDKANFVRAPQTEESGLLPATVFQAIYVSNSQQYIVLDPKISK